MTFFDELSLSVTERLHSHHIFQNSSVLNIVLCNPEYVCTPELITQFENSVFSASILRSYLNKFCGECKDFFGAFVIGMGGEIAIIYIDDYFEVKC